MELVKKISVILTIIGGLNWGLVGFFNFNLVTFLFGASMLSAITYMIIGIAAIITIFAAPSLCLFGVRK